MNFVHVPPAFSQDSSVMCLEVHWRAELPCPLVGGQETPPKLFGLTHISEKERLKKNARLKLHVTGS